MIQLYKSFLRSWAGLCLLLSLLTSMFRAEISLAEEFVFWTDQTQRQIWRAHLDGSNPIPIVNLGPSTPPLDVACDDVEQKIYFMTNAPSEIRRASFDGSENELVTSVVMDIGTLALDPLLRKVYWIDAAGMHRINMDGSSIENNIGTSPPGVPDGFAINAGTQTMYLSGQATDSVYLGDLTHLPIEPQSFLNVLSPRALAVDARSPLLYFINDNPSSDSEVQSYNLFSQALLPHFNIPFPTNVLNMALNDPVTHVYWTDSFRQGIFRSSLASPQIVQIAPAPEPFGIALSCGIFAPDDDGDGSANCRDNCANDPDKIEAGACGCAIPDTDSDSDGVLDCNDACPVNPLKINPDTCGCANPDDDSDSDGILDCVDACPADSLKASPGVCGCGIPDLDSDNDGSFDCQDACPSNPQRTVADVCGCNLTAATLSDGSNACFELKILSPDVKTVQAPLVRVNGHKVLIILEKFSGVSFDKQTTSPAHEESFSLSEAKKRPAKASVSYDVVIAPSGPSKSDVVRTTSKRNELTVRSVKTGNYTVKYRANIVRNGKVVFRTKFSAKTKFSVGLN